MATVPQRFEPCYTEMASLNAFVDPNSTLNHLAVEHVTVSGGSFQATAVVMPKANLSPPDRHPAWFPATLSEQDGHYHHTGSTTGDNTTSSSNSCPEQFQHSFHANPTKQKRPMRRKQAATVAQFPGCLTLDLGLQSATAKVAARGEDESTT